MNVQPINSYSTSYKGSKIPKSAKLVNMKKRNDIEALELASTFRKFEEDFRTAIQTFVYMVKNIG